MAISIMKIRAKKYISKCMKIWIVEQIHRNRAIAVRIKTDEHKATRIMKSQTKTYMDLSR